MLVCRNDRAGGVIHPLREEGKDDGSDANSEVSEIFEEESSTGHYTNSPGDQRAFDYLVRKLELNINRLLEDLVVDVENRIGSSRACERDSTVDLTVFPGFVLDFGGDVREYGSQGVEYVSESVAPLSMQGGGEFQGNGSSRRRQLRVRTCYNCGSPSHVVTACREPINDRRVAENRTRDTPESSFNGRFYAYSRKAEAFSHLRVGVLSDELKAALGMEKNDPPPYLLRMMTFGYPPGYTAARAKRVPVDVDLPESETTYLFDIPGLNAPLEPNIIDPNVAKLSLDPFEGSWRGKPPREREWYNQAAYEYRGQDSRRDRDRDGWSRSVRRERSDRFGDPFTTGDFERDDQYDVSWYSRRDERNERVRRLDPSPPRDVEWGAGGRAMWEQGYYGPVSPRNRMEWEHGRHQGAREGWGDTARDRAYYR